ncbi:flagella synthesis protein FlgN [Rhodanobacter umsongensis]|uniref:Flagella synthesis protein FlgN n=1 Tax=Rhodanobacter umsongensis TaxID=633153 RepID=A0ABW0JM86_9GAMM
MNSPLQHELNAALAAVLDDMQQAVAQLGQVLQAERTALDTSSSEALDQAGARKQAIMQQLEQLDAERQLLGREQPEAAAALEPVWARIVVSLRECHLLNQRNGSAVNLRLTQVRQALAVLTGHAGESELYGRSGELRTHLRSQVLAAA